MPAALGDAAADDVLGRPLAVVAPLGPIGAGDAARDGAGAAKVRSGVGEAAAAVRMVTGANTSLVELGLLRAPMVYTPRTTFRQSIVRYAPDASW